MPVPAYRIVATAPGAPYIHLPFGQCPYSENQPNRTAATKIVGAVRKKRQGRWPIHPTVGGCPAALRNAEATDNLREKSESALKPLSRMPGFKVVYWWTPLSGSNNGPK
jgi:hypothetical protein